MFIIHQPSPPPLNPHFLAPVTHCQASCLDPIPHSLVRDLYVSCLSFVSLPLHLDPHTCCQAPYTWNSWQSFSSPLVASASYLSEARRGVARRVNSTPVTCMHSFIHHASPWLPDCMTPCMSVSRRPTVRLRDCLDWVHVSCLSDCLNASTWLWLLTVWLLCYLAMWMKTEWLLDYVTVWIKTVRLLDYATVWQQAHQALGYVTVWT